MTLVIWISFPSFPYPMVVQHENLQLAQWFQRIYEYIVQSITQKLQEVSIWNFTGR